MTHPDEAQKQDRDTFDRQALAFLSFSFIAAYFVFWHRKTKLRHWARRASLYILSGSTIIITAEVLMEFFGGKTIHGAITSFTLIPITSIQIFLFIVAVAWLLYHDYKESKKPGHEYKFVRQVWHFMQERKNAPSIDDVINTSLQVFSSMFTRAKIVRCSFYVLNGKSLGTKDCYLYPPTDDPNYQIKFKKGEGVAGKVSDDKRARYVPRLFFPFCRRKKWSPLLFFPHAVIFDIRRRNGTLELFSKGLDPFVFVPPVDGNLAFRSIVSVPVRSVDQDESFGAMNFDFRRYDPLDKSDIEMAIAFGLLLGDEIGRLSFKQRGGNT